MTSFSDRTRQSQDLVPFHTSNLDFSVALSPVSGGLRVLSSLVLGQTALGRAESRESQGLLCERALERCSAPSLGRKSDPGRGRST